jgi:uncharacterized Ntn-hydrolase superfamily protein
MPLKHTYSIVARDPQTGQMGVAVESHAFGTGTMVTWGEAGVGVVATQSLVNIDYGPEGIALMRQGYSAPQALETLLEKDKQREIRQVAMLDSQGRVAAHTGTRCIAAAGHLIGETFSVQANLMVNDSIWPAMKQAYETTEGDLADRMIAALEAAQDAGGDIRGQQSSALLVVAGEQHEKPWRGRLFDLRVDDHSQPIAELKRLLRLQRAEQNAEEADKLLIVGRTEEAVLSIHRALELAPESVEGKLWGASTLYRAGRKEEALLYLREVLAKEPIWASILPRLAAVHLLPDDPEFVQSLRELGIILS